MQLKELWKLYRIQTHDLCDTGIMALSPLELNKPTGSGHCVDCVATVWIKIVFVDCIACKSLQQVRVHCINYHYKKMACINICFRMDTKGSSAEISYPNIFFILDNFEEVSCFFLAKYTVMWMACKCGWS